MTLTASLLAAPQATLRASIRRTRGTVARSSLRATAVLGALALALAATPALAQSCLEIDRELSRVHGEMAETLLQDPATSALLGSCAAVAVVTYSETESSEAALSAGAGCLAVGCYWMSDFTTCMSVGATYARLALEKYNLEAAKAREECPV